MTEQDQANINRISELLAELKPLLYGVSHLIDQDCYAPPTDFKCANNGFLDRCETQCTTCKENKPHPDNLIARPFAPIAPVEPNTIAQTEWKEGEIVWGDNQKEDLFIIEQVYGDEKHPYDCFGKCIRTDSRQQMYFEPMVKPTPEEIQSHLTKIAEQRYPVGTRFKSLEVKDQIRTLLPFNPKKENYITYSIDFLGNLRVKNGINDNTGCSNPAIWDKELGWASIVEPIKEESKYSVFIGKNEGNYEVLVLGIENRDKAHWISYKIKQLLKEL